MASIANRLLSMNFRYLTLGTACHIRPAGTQDLRHGSDISLGDGIV